MINTRVGIDVGIGKTIAVDWGNGYMKSVSFSLKAGITQYETEPYTSSNVVKVNDKYYVCGSSRSSLEEDKTQSERYYVLTLAMIAKEIENRNLDRPTSINLVLGLPLDDYGLYKDRLIQSFDNSKILSNKQKPIKFEFENRNYEITIDDIEIYPQGYAGYYLYDGEFSNQPSIGVCDIGTWTIDMMRIDDGEPNANTCFSLPLGIAHILNESNREVKKATGLSLTTPQIESILQGKTININDNAKEIVLNYASQYIQKLIGELKENDFDIFSVPTIFMGGGSKMMKNHLEKNNKGNKDKLKNWEFIENPNINAMGFEKLYNDLNGANNE